MTTVILHAETFAPADPDHPVARITRVGDGSFLVDLFNGLPPASVPDYATAEATAEAHATTVQEAVDKKTRVDLVKDAEQLKAAIARKDSEIAELQAQVADLSAAALAVPVAEVKG